MPASGRNGRNVAGVTALTLFALSVFAIPSVFASSTDQGAVTTAPRETVVQLTCRPSSVSVNAWTLCTVKVTDTGPGLPITPTGTVSFASARPGTFSGNGMCTLSGGVFPGAPSAHCSLTFKPSRMGSYVVSARYSGDANRAGQFVFENINVK